MITRDCVPPHCTEGECLKPVRARGLCSAHYQSARKLEILPPRISPIDRLVLRLARQDSGCLEWQGHRCRKGYGSIFIDGRAIKTHRFAWELANGPISDGLYVLHKCDNPPCCDVDHLFLGTLADNNADRAAKGRSGNRWAV